MSTVSTERSKALDLAYIAVFAALLIVLAFVSIPVGTAGVPIVLQNAAIILTGLVLGARRGFLATGLFLLLGLFGLPVLAGGRSTLAALAGSTIGYVVGYLISVAVVGTIAYLAPRSSAQRFSAFALAGIAGMAIQYLCGIVGLHLRAQLDWAPAFAAQIPFLLPDMVKTGVAVVIAHGVHSAFPHLIGKKR
ncbi:biotin transporter BioY [Corynebacterium sp. ZY180755]